MAVLRNWADDMLRLDASSVAASASCSAKARSTSSRISSVSCRRSASAFGRKRIARAGNIDGHDGFDAAGARREHHDPVGQRHRLVDMMRDEQHRRAAVAPDVEQEVLHLGARLHVERRERLIHQQHLRPHRERARHGDALAHAAGQFVGPLVHRLGQADALQHLARRRLARSTLVAADREAEARILPHGKPGKQRGFLENQAALGRRRVDAIAERPDLARRTRARGPRSDRATCSCRSRRARAAR